MLKVVNGDAQIAQQDTLIYDMIDGFSWVRLADGNATWQAFFPTAAAAEEAARKVGLNPQAVCYLKTY